MQSNKVNFQNAEGEQLSARLDFPPDGKPFAYAIFAHCFTCSKDLSAVRNISRALTQQGLAVLRFDFTGLGRSEGDFAETNFASNVEDLVNAADYLRTDYSAPALLIGHSLGGAAVLFAAGQIPEIEAVVTIGAPAEPFHVAKQLGEKVEEINVLGEAEVVLAGRPFKVKKHFLEALKVANVQKTIRQLHKALLVMHSPQDKTVGVENAKHIYDAALHPKSFISLDKADHLLTNSEDALYAGEVIASWVKRYLTNNLKEELQTHSKVVVELGEKGYTTEVKMGKHGILADEPKSVGGDDLGGSPYDLLLASLGTCTAMTIRMYADRKAWPVDKIRIHLAHEKTYLEDLNRGVDKGAKIDVIEREIELHGALSTEQIERIMEIADKCPVHRTLHAEVVVKSKYLSIE